MSFIKKERERDDSLKVPSGCTDRPVCGDCDVNYITSSEIPLSVQLINMSVYMKKSILVNG